MRSCSVVRMLGDGGKPAEPTAADRAAYEAAAAKAGKNAAAHVQLALWCEAHGFSAERIKHLTARRRLSTPRMCWREASWAWSRSRANGQSPNRSKQEIQDDPKFQALFREYLDRRVRTPQRSADAQLRLAALVPRKGAQGRGDGSLSPGHPPRPVPRHRLDSPRLQEAQGPLVKARRSWPAQKLEADRQKHADHNGSRGSKNCAKRLESTVETRRLKAEREVYQVTDPRASR